MPALGADMESGTLVEWHVKPGDRVKSGDVIAVVETQKGAIEVEVFVDGIVSNILVPVGARVPVGTILAQIDGPAVEAAQAAAAPARPPAPQVVAAPVPAAKPVIEQGARMKITPVARRRAVALNIDVTALRGTGFQGSIRLADVEAAARAVPAGTPSIRRGVDPSEMRKAIAAAMSRSKRDIPHYYLSETVDLHTALSWLEDFNRDREPLARILPAVLFLKASALALRAQLKLNGFYESGAFVPASEIHIGWAVALRGGGLVAPAIRDTDRKSLSELMSSMRDLVERARRGGLRASEITSPTMTVTNVGDRGAETVTGIIYPPQVAIVGFGRVVTRPFVVDGAIAPRPLVTVSLAADHRVTDGHLGGLYLAEVARLLQEPEKL